MATSLCSALVLALQVAAPPADSVAAWWQRVATDPQDAPAWLALGRAYLGQAPVYHDVHPAGDALAVRAALDTSAAAFATATGVLPPGPARDTALAYGVFSWVQTTLLAWEEEGLAALAELPDPTSERVRLPAVLAELGENLLRACPAEAVLLTADETDTAGAWLLRFARRLRADLLVVPLRMVRTDILYRGRVGDALEVPVEVVDDAVALWRAVAARRPLCASMAFPQPPLGEAIGTWRAAPLVWVTGADATGVAPPGDFVFEAARLARDRRGAWIEPVLELYRRAAAASAGLCPTFVAFNLGADMGCVRTD